MTLSKINTLEIFQDDSELVETDIGFLYIRKNFQLFPTFPFNNCYGVLCDLGDKEVESAGFPLELIQRSDFSTNMPSVVYEKTEKIVCYIPLEYGSRKNLLDIIKVFNTLPFTNLTVYAPRDLSNPIRSFANDNITIIDYQNPKELNISTNIILTFGYCTRSFICKKIPTIVLGPYGMGGWVTPDNIQYLLRENFRGRPGGKENEGIPVEILVDEFMEIREHPRLDTVLNVNARKLKNYLGQFRTTTIEQFIANRNLLYQKLQDTSERNLLIPKLPSNVKTIISAKTVFVQRDLIGDVLFSLPKEESKFIDDLSMGKTCKDIQRNHEISYDDFWEVLFFLWNKKAIIFK